MERLEDVEMEMEMEIPEQQAPRAPLVGSFQSVTLEAWLRHKTGAQFDQAAGFRAWARKHGHSRHSSAEWEQLFTEFHNKPVG